jgi:hypothetical protein
MLMGPAGLYINVNLEVFLGFPRVDPRTICAVPSFRIRVVIVGS